MEACPAQRTYYKPLDELLTMTIRADGTSRLYSTTYFASARAGAFIQKMGPLGQICQAGPLSLSPRPAQRKRKGGSTSDILVQFQGLWTAILSLPRAVRTSRTIRCRL
jgi:hypothetical protein